MEEIVEQVVDSAADLATGRVTKLNVGHLAIVSAVALGTGAGLAWFAARKRYQSQFDKQVEEIRLEAKAFYSQFYKKDEFATPGDAVEALGAEADAGEQLSEGGEAAVAALKSYGSHRLEDVAVTVTETTEVAVEPITSNVFRDRHSNDVWDQDAEEAARETLSPGEPYIICDKEFLENEHDYEQQTFTYFADDDVLVDEKDQPIEQIDQVVGEENLTRFGFGSSDNRIVRVRNDRLHMDFEVIKNDGSYAKEVLGFQHSDVPPKVRKMRREVE